MAYKRYRLSKTRAKEFAQKMQEQEESYNFIKTDFPLRVGCYVKFIRKSDGELIDGIIKTSSYGANTGLHTFNVNGILVRGKNLYDRLLVHKPGLQSFLDRYERIYKKQAKDIRDLIMAFPEFFKIE